MCAFRLAPSLAARSPWVASIVLGWSAPVCVGPWCVRQAAMLPDVGKNLAEWSVQHVSALHAHVVVDPDPYSSDAAAI